MTVKQLQITFEKIVKRGTWDEKVYDFSKNNENEYIDKDTNRLWDGYFICAAEFNIVDL